MEEFRRTGDDTGLAGMFDPDCKFKVPRMPDTLEGIRQALPALRQAFSDIVIRLDPAVSEGDMIGYQMSFIGTHSGGFMGILPTGRRSTTPETHIERIRDGKILLHGGSIDMMRLMQ